MQVPVTEGCNTQFLCPIQPPSLTIRKESGSREKVSAKLSGLELDARRLQDQVDSKAPVLKQTSSGAKFTGRPGRASHRSKQTGSCAGTS